MTDKDEALSLEQTLRLALEALENLGNHDHVCPQWPTYAEPENYPKCNCGYDQAITAIKAALEAKDEPVQEPWESEMRNELVALGFDGQCPESIGITLKRWRDGYAAAQRKPLTDEEIQDALEVEFLGSVLKRNWQDDLRVARAIEAAHGIIDPTDLKGEA